MTGLVVLGMASGFLFGVAFERWRRLWVAAHSDELVFRVKKANIVRAKDTSAAPGVAMGARGSR